MSAFSLRAEFIYDHREFDYAFDSVIDLHCHLLPGVDDGARTMPESIEMAKGLADLGFSIIAPSPHFGMGPGGDVSHELAGEVRAKLVAEFQAQSLELRLEANAEHHLTGSLFERIDQGDIQPIAGQESGWVLTELPWIKGADVHRAVFEMQRRGYKILLAHPERIEYLELSDIEALVSRGVRTQLELGSFHKQYGRHVAKKAQAIVKKGLAHLFASDLHRPAQLKYIKLGLEWLNKRGMLQQAMVDNPGAILNGQSAEEIPALLQ